MSCETCEFCPPYSMGETIRFTVEILVWDEVTSTYVGVDSLNGFDALYILRQGDVTLSFALSDPEISVEGDYTFVVAVPSSEITGIEPGKVEHEFWYTDASNAETQVFSSYFTAKTSVKWEES